jgi:peptide/nickel transport system substrate-binding protein
VPAIVAGCSGSKNDTSAVTDSSSDTLLEPFTPPPLADIEAKAGWTDLPVVDAMDRLRERQAGEKPEVTVAEALALKNDSDANNAKIVSALGRLPEKPTDVNWDSTFTRHFPTDVKALNPILASSSEEFDMGSLMGVNLFSFDWNLKPFAVSQFVKSWQASSDQMIHKVVMRDDMTWSDGKPITAHDVEFSFRQIMNPKIQVPALRSGCDMIKAVIAYDDHTVLYFHKEKLATNIWNVNFSLMPKHIYESTIPGDTTLLSSPRHVELEENPVCGGMYTLSRRTRNQEIVLERRESYYMHNGKQVREKPYFKTVRFLIIQEPATALLALKKGDIDEMLLNPEFWMTQTNDDEFYAKNTKVRGTEWSYSYFGWNLKTPYFDDVRVRKAMSYAMDYDEMLNKLCYGLYEPCSGVFHPTAWMYPKGQITPYKQDLNQAEKLLEEAGWTDTDGDGIRDKEVNGKLVKFEFTMLTLPLPIAVNICSLMKENLAKIGVNCEIQRVERTVLQQRLMDKQYEAVIANWGTGADPSTMDNIFETGKERNWGSYSNKEVDRLFNEAEKAFSTEEQAKLYGQLDKQIWDDQPYTFLYYRSSFQAFNKQLRGYVFSPRGPFHYSPGFDSMWRASGN